MHQLTLEKRTQLDALLTVGVPEAQEETLSADLGISLEEVTTEASQESAPSRPQSALHALKQDVGPLSLERVLQEIAKLERIHQLGLPADLFDHVSAKTVDSYRNRIAVEDLQEVRRHPDPIRYTLLAAYCWRRRQEIVDTLVQLLLDVAHHLSTKAERRVEKAFVKDIKKVSGKTNLLFRLAEAAIDKPDGTVREVVFPVVSEQTLRDLVKEYKASGSTYQQQVQKAMRGPYSKHYWRMVPVILKHLAFCSNNEVHQPIIQALDLLKKYIDVPLTQPHFASSETVPLDEIVPASWRKAVLTSDKTEQVSRVNYELCVLHTLREKVRSKEVWVQHAGCFRDPHEDLPKDFARKRTIYYDALHLPTSSDAFIQRLQAEMTTALEQLNQNIPDNPYVRLLSKSDGWISLSPLPPQPQPQHLRLLKGELGTRWPMIELLDILKETDLRVRFTDRFHTLTLRENLDRATIQKRLLLGLYGLGTNIGLKRVCAGDQSESYRDVLYVCQRFLTKDALRAAIADVANAIFRVRRPDIWGEGTTACASDSKKYAAWDQNLMTEWHPRYRGPGVLIYWHVERKAVCIYSQLRRCSSSEVAAMITGLLRHATEMQVERNYVDTHRQSEIGFAFCSLLGFQLLPRLKNLHAQKLYRPETGYPDAYPNLQPVLTRPIKWELIRQQYDEMVKFATALRLGTAETEEILRRFTRNGVQHPTYAALLELGKVQRTIFLCHYLSSEELRREIQEGLNVIENWNSATNFIHFGRLGEFSTNTVEDQELAMLTLHLLQIALTYVQTLMIQEVLSEPAWMSRMTKEDLRGLTPLIYSNVNPYGLIRLNMAERLRIERAEAV